MPQKIHINNKSSSAIDTGRLLQFYSGNKKFTEIAVDATITRGMSDTLDGWYNAHDKADVIGTMSEGLETAHNFIQILFPTKKISKYGDIFPVISDTAEFLNAINSSTDKNGILENFTKCFNLMCRHFEALPEGNLGHNKFRISRMLESMELFPFEEAQKKTMLEALRGALSNRNDIGESVGHYNKAVGNLNIGLGDDFFAKKSAGAKAGGGAKAAGAGGEAAKAVGEEAAKKTKEGEEALRKEWQDYDRAVARNNIIKAIADFQSNKMERASQMERAEFRETLGGLVVKYEQHTKDRSDTVKKLIDATTQEHDSHEFLNPLFEILYAEKPAVIAITTNILMDEADKGRGYVLNPKVESRTLPIIEPGNYLTDDFLDVFFDGAKDDDLEILRDVNLHKPDGKFDKNKRCKRKITHTIEADTKEIVFNFGRTISNRAAANRTDATIAITCDKNFTKDGKTFAPTAFIVHKGTIEGGHYIAYVKERTAEGAVQWACYNDSTKSIVTTEKINKEIVAASLIKYSLSSEALPKAQANGTQNSISIGGVSYENRCWFNASLALLLSCTSIPQQQDVPEPTSPRPAAAPAPAPKTATAENVALAETYRKAFPTPEEEAEKKDAGEAETPLTDKQKKIKANIDVALETQKSKSKPTGAYRGIGMAVEAVEDADGKITKLKILQVYAKNIERFQYGGASSGSEYCKDNTVNSFNDKFITEVWINNVNTKISDLSEERIAAAFHSSENVTFKICDEDGKNEQIIVSKTHPFVAQSCVAAKEKLASEEKLGDIYNPTEYGLGPLGDTAKLMKDCEKELGKVVAAVVGGRG